MSASGVVTSLGLNNQFLSLLEALPLQLEHLLAMKPVPYGLFPCDMPKSGVYLFSEKGRHLYVGRSNTLRKRHGRHCCPGATYKQAAFAFLLAREATG
jgi:hypothetical protein